MELPPGSRADDHLEKLKLRAELSLTRADVEGCRVLVNGVTARL